MAALPLHSLEEFDQVVFELLDRARPRSVLEMGPGAGAFSERLLKRCDAIGARFTSIDAHPPEHLARRAQASTTFDIVVGPSLPYLRKHGCEHDFVLIDGEHSYFTLTNELELVHASWGVHGIAGTILIHHVRFPGAEGIQTAVEEFLNHVRRLEPQRIEPALRVIELEEALAARAAARPLEKKDLS